MKNLRSLLYLLVIGTLGFISCKKKTDGGAASDEVQTSCTDINLFSINQDIALGAQVDSQITADPQYVILDSAANANNAWAYQYLNGIKREIFNNANVDYETRFKWKVAIIKDDSTLNAFCTPGGYIYVYTGIIKYLDTEDDFAGVLGHEIGHAALRHSTDAMGRQVGIQTLISIVLGNNPGVLATLATNLSQLSYSRCHETQSDEYSVALLKNTKYKCNGAASFFQKLVDAGSQNPPEFLSTHPSPDNRVENINAQADRLQCNKSVPASNTEWAKLKSIL